MAFVVIPDEQYQQHMKNIMALKPRKRKLWKAHNTWNGIRTTMRYENNEITDYMHAAQKRVPVKPVSYIATQHIAEPQNLRGLLLKQHLQDPQWIQQVEDYMAELWHTGNHTSRNNHISTRKKNTKPHKAKY